MSVAANNLAWIFAALACVLSLLCAVEGVTSMYAAAAYWALRAIRMGPEPKKDA